jgi:solute carrier family 6 GABA transporter-like protein 1
MFLLEGAIGQYTSTGAIGVWDKVAPLFKGVGYAALIIAFWSNSYYIIVLAWNNFYLYNSFTTNALPWNTCDNYWNTDKCVSSIGIKSMNVSAKDSVTSADEFWLYRVLNMTDGIENQGSIRWELVITLFITWVVIYFCIWRGIKWTGKIVYFTSIFPYVMLFILLVRGLTLPGAWDGIKYLFIPKWELLLSSEVWIDAVTQIFFSYGLGVGSVIALGSYNKFNNNIYR